MRETEEAVSITESFLDQPTTERGSSIQSEPPALAKVKHKDVAIKPLSIGYVLTVGCQSVAVTTTEDLLTALTRIYTDKIDEQEYNRRKRAGTAVDYLFK